MLMAGITVALVPKEELGFSLPIMPLEDWLSQIQNRFHAFYADGIGLNLLMLPETVGLFLFWFIRREKDIFRRAKELDSKLKNGKLLCSFYITNVVLHGPLLLIKTIL